MKTNILISLLFLFITSALAREHDPAGTRDTGTHKPNVTGNSGNTAPNFQPSFTLPPVSSAGPVNAALNIQKINAQVLSNLKFDPILSVNPNRGSFRTSFNVDLPPNLVNFNQLTLNYLATRPTNIGLGIGWQWSLPLIKRSLSGDSQTPYYTTGMEGAGELTVSGESVSDFEDYLNRLTKKYFAIDIGKAKYVSYKKVLEDKFNNYILVSSNDLKRGWILLKTNGTKWIFDNAGYPISFEDSFSNGLLFSWDKSLLSTITDQASGWTAQLEYLPIEDTHRLPVFNEKGEVYIPDGLKTITITHPLQSDKVHKVNFHYQGQYLERAEDDGGIIPLFQASYDYPTLTNREDFFPSDNNIDKRVLFTESLLEKKEIMQDHTTNNKYIYTDINGDGRTDRLVIKEEVMHKNLVDKFKHQPYRIRTRADDVDDINNFGFRQCWGSIPTIKRETLESDIERFIADDIYIEFSVWNRQRQELNWIREKGLNLKDLKLRTSDHRVDVHQDWIREKSACRNSDYYKKNPSNTFFTPRSVPNGIFLVDLDSDGRRDFISCRGSFDADAVNTYGSKDPIIKDGQRINRQHSNFNMSLLKLFNRSELGDRTFTDIFSDKLANQGNGPTVFIQKVDREKLEKLWKEIGENQPNNHHLGQIIPNATTWQKKVDANFLCNQYSQFFDANRDGKIDVLTGKKLYLNTADNTYKKVDLTLDQIKSLYEIDEKKIDLSSTDLLLVDTDGDGKIELRNGIDFYKNPMAGQSFLVTKEGSHLIRPNKGHKYLQEYRSHFGGKYKIDYKLASGVWSTSQITSFPGAGQPSIIRSFRYLTPMKDPFTGTFLGFHKTIEHIKTDHEFTTPREIETEYMKDLDDQVTHYKTRAQLSGYPMRIKVKDTYSEKFRDIKEYTWSFRPLNNLNKVGKLRIFGWSSIKWDYLKPKNHDAISTQSKVFTNYVDWLVKDDIDILPLDSFVADIDGGVEPGSAISLFSNGVHLRESRFKYFPHLYSLKTIYKKSLGQDNIQYEPVLTTNYDDQTGILVSSCREKECTKYEYDSLGRLTRTEDPRGYWTSASYIENLPLVEEARNSEFSDHGIKYKYDYITGLNTEEELPWGGRKLYSYSNDGLLKSVRVASNDDSNTDTEVYQVQLDQQSLTDNWKILEPKVKTKMLDGEFVQHLDGFGRLTFTESDTNDGVIFGSKSLLGEGDVIIQQTTPSFNQSSEVPFASFFRDYKNREIRIIRPGIGFKITKYFDRCLRETGLNRLNEYRHCTDLFGNIMIMKHKGIENGMTVNYRGEILSNSTYGQSYERDLFSEINYTRSEYTKDQDQASWGSTKIIDRKNRIRTFADGKKIIYDHSDRVIKTERTDNDSHPSDLLEEISYEAGLKKSHTFSNRGKQLDFLRTDFEYNSFGMPTSIETESVRTSITYDKYLRKSNISIFKEDKKVVDFVHQYAKNQLIGLDPLISNVKRNEFGKITSVSFNNGLTMRYEYSLNSYRITKIEYTKDGKSIHSESFTYYDQENNTPLKQNARNTNLMETRLIKSELFHDIQDEFTYDDNLNLDGFDVKSNHRSQTDKIVAINDNKFSWRDDNLVSNAQLRFYYDHNGSMKAACPLAHPTISKLNCLIKQDAHTFLYNGTLIKKIDFEGIPVAVLIGSEVYPVITDHLGSIKGMLSPDANTVLWSRTYDAWGDKHSYFNQSSSISLQKVKELESLTLWSYAQLIEIPSINSGDIQLYWSQSRVYSPNIKRWLSADPMIKWNPDNNIGRRFNWHPTRYAENNPISFIDPSGYFSQPTWHMFNSMGVGQQVWNEMRAAGNAMLDAAKYAGAAIALIAAGSAAPALVAAAAPKIAAYSLAGTMHYNIALMSAGQFVARNPNFISNAYEFTSNLFDGTSHSVPSDLYGMAGATLNWSYKEFMSRQDNMGSSFDSTTIDSGPAFKSPSESFSNSFEGSWWNQ